MTGDECRIRKVLEKDDEKSVIFTLDCLAIRSSASAAPF